jgi:two-component system, NarL family, response regulator DesR
VIRVLVAQGTPLFRGALVALLGTEADIEVVGESGEWPELAEAVPQTRPDVVVLYVQSPGRDIVPRVARLCRSAPGTRTLVLVDAGRHDVLDGACENDLRAIGFVSKQASAEHLLSAVRSLASGAPVVDPQLVASRLASPDNPLTERERGILTLAAEGAQAREIAGKLCLSAGTVRNCLSRINTKMGASNRIQAIRRAQQAGWI